MRRLVGLLCLLLLTVPGVQWTVAAASKQILILDSFGREVSPFGSLTSAFRTTLARELGEPVEIYELSLDLARLNHPGMEAAHADYLRHIAAARRFDLVVPIGSPAVKFALQHRDRLFPATPMLAVGLSPQLVSLETLDTNATLVTHKINLRGMVENILRIAPDTTNILVVFGVSPLEQFWAAECAREFQAFTNRVSFTWLSDLSLDQMCRRVAVLPPHSAILYGLLILDAAGVPCDDDTGLRRLHAVANAPLYGYFQSQFGLGTMGGRLYPDETVGAQAARAAVRILHGEKPGDLPPQFVEASPPVYDWRELRRWHIDQARLPAGSLIRFREPTFWARYKWEIILVVSLCLVEAMLIVGLMANLVRRRRVEKALRQSEDQYRQLFDQMVNGIMVCEVIPDKSGKPCDYRLVQANPAFEKLTGRRLQDELGKTGKDMSIGWPPEVQQRLFEVAATGKAIEYERFSDSLGRWYETRVFAPRPGQFAHVFNDVTARRRAEDEVRQKQGQLLAAMEIARLAYWDYDVLKDEFTLNDQFYTLLRSSADREGGYTMSSARYAQRFVHPDDVELFRAEIHKAIASTDPEYRRELDHRIVYGDGTTGYVALHIRPRRDAKGRAVRAYGANLDITDRKRVEADLTRSIREVIDLKTTLDNHTILATTDPQGKITYVNDKFCAVSEYTREELMGQDHRIVNSGYHSKEFFRDLWTTIQACRVWQGDIRIRAKDGSFHWLATTIVPFLDARGKPRQFVAIRYDITERKQAEATAQALSRRLITAQEEERARLARELHDDLTQRLARLAIDVGRLERGTHDAPTTDTMRGVREELVRLSEDVHALSHRLHPSLLEDLGLAEALKAECDRFSRQASVSVTVKLREFPGTVPRDAALCLFRIAQGSLANIARHARARRVEVSLRGLDGGLQLAVRDDGVGFDPALPRRAPGLGLASMRERAHLVGGELDTESAPGQGTTILAWVPLEKGPA